MNIIDKDRNQANVIGIDTEYMSFDRAGSAPGSEGKFPTSMGMWSDAKGGSSYALMTPFSGSMNADNLMNAGQALEAARSMDQDPFTQMMTTMGEVNRDPAGQIWSEAFSEAREGGPGNYTHSLGDVYDRANEKIKSAYGSNILSERGDGDPMDIGTKNPMFLGSNIAQADTDIVQTFTGHTTGGIVELGSDAPMSAFREMSDVSHPVHKMYAAQGYERGGSNTTNLQAAYKQHINPQVGNMLREEYGWDDAKIDRFTRHQTKGVTNVSDMFLLTGGKDYYQGQLDSRLGGAGGKLRTLSMGDVHHQAGADAFMEYKIYQRAQTITQEELAQGHRRVVAGRVHDALVSHADATGTSAQSEQAVWNAMGRMDESIVKRISGPTGPTSGPASHQENIKHGDTTVFKKASAAADRSTKYLKEITGPSIGKAISKLPGWKIAGIGAAALVAGNLMYQNRRARESWANSSHRAGSKRVTYSSDRVSMALAAGG